VNLTYFRKGMQTDEIKIKIAEITRNGEVTLKLDSKN
jgi:hypothetical protein